MALLFKLLLFLNNFQDLWRMTFDNWQLLSPPLSTDLEGGTLSGRIRTTHTMSQPLHFFIEICSKWVFSCYCLPTKLRESNVLHMCLSAYSWGRRSHVTITHDALEFTVQFTPTPWPHQFNIRYGNPCLWACTLLRTSCGHHRRPSHTCSLKDLPFTSIDIWWPPKHIQFTSGRNTPYWDTYLFLDTINVNQRIYFK